MNEPMDQLREGPGEFRLADWRVYPQLNRLERGGEEMHLEPRVMDLLVFLARHPERVMSKEEIIEVVWEGQFITDSALTRAVADLRKALGDDVRQPRFVATVTKRGYRLVAPVEWASPAVPKPAADAQPRNLTVGHVFALTWRERTLPLPEGEHLIGRDPEGAVSISSRKVSRRHARIVVDASGAKLEDLGSKNGTHVNGRRIDRAVELVDGDEITVGPAKLSFRAFVPEGSTETELFTRTAASRIGLPRRD